MQLPTLSEKSLVYNITLRWFLLQHVHWNRSFHVWISPFVIKLFPESMVQVSGSADLDNLKLTLTLPSTSYVTLESNSLFGSWFSTWEMKNLNWVTTKFPSRFKILLFIWVNICLAETCSMCSLTQPGFCESSSHIGLLSFLFLLNTTSFFNHVWYDEVSRPFTILVILLWTWVFQCRPAGVAPRTRPGLVMQRGISTPYPCAQPPGQWDPRWQVHSPLKLPESRAILCVLEALLQAACRTDAGAHGVISDRRWCFPQRPVSSQVLTNWTHAASW